MASVADSGSSPMSRVLFLNETGKPMRFFMRPGAVKAQLQPVICAGGGVVCKMQEPNAILLMAPEEMNEVPVSAAPQYVSSQYILDCVEKNLQLEVDDYRFRDDRVHTTSAKRKREGSGRMSYTAEEDAAILRFVRGHKQEVCGNSLWKRMASETITGHSWQSMKCRYHKHLAKQPLEGDTEQRQKAGGIEGSPNKLLTVPLKQKDATQSSHQIGPLTPSPKKVQLQPPSEEKNTNCSPERTLPQPSAEPTSPQPLPERARPQRSPQKMQPHPSPGRKQLPLGQTHAQSATIEKTSPALTKKTYPVIFLDKIHPRLGAGKPHSWAGEGSSVGKDVAGLNVTSTGTTPQKRPTPQKRTLGVLDIAVKEFEDLDESEDDTPDINLRSTAGADCNGLDKGIGAATSAEVIQENDDDDDGEDDANKDDAEPQPEKSPDIQLTHPDKDRGPEISGPAPKTSAPLNKEIVAATSAEVIQENNDDDDGEDDANRDDAEPQPEKSPDIQLAPPDKDRGPEISGPASKTSAPLNKEIVAATSAEVIQENDEEDDEDDANEDDAEPQPEKSPDVQLAPPDKDGGPEISGPAPKTSAPLTTKVHMFLFDRESQEEEPSWLACEPSFTQAQLEEARQQMRYLMKESGQDLDSVTKALLKNSGSVRAALQYLRNGPQGYLWDPRDDGLLRSGGPSLRTLEQKYGKAAVARRIAFLDIQ